MVNKYSIIKDNKVINRIVADSEFVVVYCNEIGASYSTFPGAVIGAERVDDEWVVARAVPQVVSKAQAVLALDALGLLDDVEDYMATAPKQHRLAWENGQTIERQGNTVRTVAVALAWDDARLDELFITADGIVL